MKPSTLRIISPVHNGPNNGLYTFEITHQAQRSEHAHDSEHREVDETQVGIVYPASDDNKEIKAVEFLGKVAAEAENKHPDEHVDREHHVGHHVRRTQHILMEDRGCGHFRISLAEHQAQNVYNVDSEHDPLPEGMAAHPFTDFVEEEVEW